ncbi:nitroreductase family protein [uncultured Clostridium sp.]|uniref:nitroreductase family protein n=1 Tax=uncultured Clostridium sp. TaxID=59620 RepID=UPI0025EEF51C|nr:nitroreductase family protein [uncultured Clostridium sp.]
MMNNKLIKEVISDRHSVRSYNDNQLSKDIIDKIENYITNLTNPFDRKVKIKLIRKHTGSESIKLGTYGVIKGAEYFLVAACKKDELSLIALGYELEKLILYCTSLGLGTVWLGGTFKKSDFAKVIDLEDDEIMPIVSPVGYEGGKKSLFAIIAGKNTNKRKAFSEVFFKDDFSTPLTKDDAKEFFEPLEMIRLAPSSVNKQPWRVIKENNEIHFYFANSKNSTIIDMGIALCHFHLTAMENNLEGEFVVNDPKKENKNLTYIISWVQR